MSEALRVRRVVAAPPDRVYQAWTEPEQLLRWWGPSNVTCTHAEVDARAGGAYRLDNRLPDGSVVVIRGEFLECKPPTRLQYTWWVTPGPQKEEERVTVEFNPHPEGTEVVLHHERIATVELARGHEQGWLGCLAGLEAILEGC